MLGVRRKDPLEEQHTVDPSSTQDGLRVEAWSIPWKREYVWECIVGTAEGTFRPRTVHRVAEEKGGSTT